MVTSTPSARELEPDEVQLVDVARQCIDANTDAGPDKDGVHTMGAASAPRTAAPSTASTCSTSPATRAPSSWP